VRASDRAVTVDLLGILTTWGQFDPIDSLRQKLSQEFGLSGF
jgi:hypothetical protein